MSAEDRVRWDQIYRQRFDQPYPAPDPLLLQFTPAVPQDQLLRALDFAGGQGQNGLWLAEQGYYVDIIDISRVGLQRARAEMAIRNLRNVNLLQIDFDDIQLDDEIYDMVCVFRYLRRDLFGQLMASVKSGGRLIYETYNTRYLELVPEFNTAFLLHPGELELAFQKWHVLHYEEPDHNARLVAVRP